MIFTAEQLVAHLAGDYILQSHWMAVNKTQRFLPAAVHASIYSSLFLLFHPSLAAFAVILITHYFIDRFRLARYLVWAKNHLGPDNARWEFCKATGYPPDIPQWLAVWLLIIADNILHIVINGLALHVL